MYADPDMLPTSRVMKTQQTYILEIPNGAQIIY